MSHTLFYTCLPHFSALYLFLQVWDLRQHAHVASIRAHEVYASCLAVLPGGQYMVTGGKDTESAGLKMWDLRANGVPLA